MSQRLNHDLMNRIYIFLLIVISSLCLNKIRGANVNELKQSFASHINVDSVFFDFGKINLYEGDYISHSFKLTNISSTVTEISDIILGCNCIEIKKHKTLISPGETIEITIRYAHNGNNNTFFRKKILIFFDEGKFYLPIGIRGDIVK